jgi:hypothetical protein
MIEYAKGIAVFSLAALLSIPSLAAAQVFIANPQVYTPPPPQAGAPQGGLFRGAAGGAAL